MPSGWRCRSILPWPRGTPRKRRSLRHCLLGGGSATPFVCRAPVYTLAHQTLLSATTRTLQAVVYRGYFILPCGRAQRLALACCLAAGEVEATQARVLILHRREVALGARGLFCSILSSRSRTRRERKACRRPEYLKLAFSSPPQCPCSFSLFPTTLLRRPTLVAERKKVVLLIMGKRETLITKLSDLYY